MVTKSCYWIDEVRRKLSQELKTGHRNSKERAIEISAKWARDAETRRTDLKMWRKKLNGCFRK